MGRHEELVVASIDRLETHGWVVGPAIEAEVWRRRLRAAARQRGWRLAAGIGATGYRWAARTDLVDETGTPWKRLGLTARSFFSAYPPHG